MSAKKKRAWFVCPRWRTLIADHYSSDIEAARALRTDPRVLAKLRTGIPGSEVNGAQDAATGGASPSAWRITERSGDRHPTALIVGDTSRSIAKPALHHRGHWRACGFGRARCPYKVPYRASPGSSSNGTCWQSDPHRSSLPAWLNRPGESLHGTSTLCSLNGSGV
jgi:hypothetical protein